MCIDRLYILGRRMFPVIFFAIVFSVTVCAANSPIKKSIEAKEILEWQKIGESVDGRPIEAVTIGRGEKITLILGAFHGDEPVSADITYKLAEYLASNYNDDQNIKVVVVPVVNPDGLAKKTRTNSNGVDINRNFPTKNWSSKYRKKRYFPGSSPGSEPETLTVIDLIEKFHPSQIISIHQPFKVVNFDGPAEQLANKMASLNSYPVKSDIGYATPGSFGTYTGKERSIPTITLELGEKTLDESWGVNKSALIEAIKYLK